LDSDTIHRRRWWIQIVLSLAVLVISMDNSILNVALPTIARTTSASTSELQWMVDAYVLVYAGLLMTAGTLGDRYGRRKLLVLGTLVIGGGSLAILGARTATELIAIRGFMGIGAALICPTTLSITTNIFDDDERPKAIAMWSVVSSLGMVVGPIVGGWILEWADWTGVFLVNVPYAALILVATLRLVPETRDPHPGGLDPVGAVLSMAGLSSLVYGIIEAPNRGWGDPQTIAWILGGLAVSLVFVAWELRSRAPMLDVRLFASRRFGGANLALTITSFALMGVLFSLTQYLQLVLGFAPMVAGFALLPQIAGLVIGAAIAARLAPVIGTRLLVAMGLGVIASTLWILSFAGVAGPYALVGVITGVAGIGFGLAYIPATDSVMGSLPRERAGVGSAMNDTTRQVGGALGIAVLGSLLASGYRDAIAPTASALPEAIGGAVRESVGAAVTIAAGLGGAQGAALLQAARSSFVDGMSGALIGGMVVMAGAAVAALVVLPARGSEHAEAGLRWPDAEEAPAVT